MRRGTIGTWLSLCATGLFLTACATEAPRGQEDYYYGEGTARQGAVEQPSPYRQEGFNHATLAYPTGERSTSALLIERTSPSEVSVGQSFEQEIKVTNISSATLRGVTIVDRGGQNFNLESATGESHRDQGGTVYLNVGDLSPQESKTLRVRGTASSLGTLQDCVSATYDQTACLAINVVQPQLSLTAKAPSEVLLCEQIPFEYTIVNNGTGMARGVTIRSDMPQGMTSLDGKSAMMADVGNLAPGQSRTFVANVKVDRAGAFRNTASATGENGLKADAEASTTVRQPKLEIKASGPESLYMGRSGTLNVTITNTGDGEARDLMLMASAPGGARLMSTSGQMGNQNQWSLGSLKAGESRQMNLTLSPADYSGDMTTNLTAKAMCANDAAASVLTRVSGVSGILLQMIDDHDPVEVGQNVTYLIRVTNQGTATDTNIKITAAMEDAVEFVSASGATTGSASGGTVTFQPLASLAPKQSANWTVVVRAKSDAQSIFKVSLTSDQVTRPAEKTEPTRLFK